MVVPDHDPGQGGMGRLQIWVQPVLGISVAVICQGAAWRAGMRPHWWLPAVGFIDIVAQEEHHIRLIGHQMAVAAEIAVFVVLTRGEGEGQRGRDVTRRGCVVRLRPTALDCPRA